MDFGPLTDLYTVIVAIVASGLLAGFNWATGWKPWLDRITEGWQKELGAIVKAIQPVIVALIVLVLDWLAGATGLDMTLGKDCLIGGMLEACDAWSQALAAALVAIPFREILARLPWLKTLYAK